MRFSKHDDRYVVIASAEEVSGFMGCKLNMCLGIAFIFNLKNSNLIEAIHPDAVDSKTLASLTKRAKDFGEAMLNAA